MLSTDDRRPCVSHQLTPAEYLRIIMTSLNKGHEKYTYLFKEKDLPVNAEYQDTLDGRLYHVDLIDSLALVAF